MYLRKFGEKYAGLTIQTVGKLFKACIAGLLVVSATSASAALIGPVYPAPGNNTFSSAGSQISAAGATRSYGGFDTSAFSELYWGASSSSLPTAGLDGVDHVLSFLSASGTTATWTGTTSWFNHNTNQTLPSVALRLVIDIGGLGANPWATAASLGLSPSIGALVNVSSGSSFTANLKFMADTGSGFQALNTIDATNLTRAGFAGAFYYADPLVDPAAVPEPQTIALFGLGLLAIAVRRRTLRR